LHRGRATWLLWAVFYYSLFELLAPLAVLAPTRYLRVAEGIAFSAVATALTWLILRRRVE
jgi:hypothetical protein